VYFFLLGLFRDLDELELESYKVSSLAIHELKKVIDVLIMYTVSFLLLLT